MENREAEQKQYVKDTKKPASKPEKCPKCGGPVVKRISSPAIQFKGSGWYVTDYARKSSVASKADAPASASASTKDSSTSSPKSTTSQESSAKGSSPTQ